MIAKNGIDWDAMGFTVYGKCPEYGSVLPRRNKISDKRRNISFLPQYKLWSRLLQMDRGNEWSKIVLCEEWKEFEVFEKWYLENHYTVEDDAMEISFNFFDFDNTYASPETCCFLPRKIKMKNKRDYGLIELVEKYKNNMPEKVRIRCEELCEVIRNGK